MRVVARVRCVILAETMAHPASPGNDAPTGQPFEIDRAIALLREAVQPFRKAALFELFEEGYCTPFEQLIACIVSIRTRDEDTVPISKRLFARARTPGTMSQLDAGEINRLLAGSTFREGKAPQILEIARRTVAEYGGELPCDLEKLLDFRGVGIKCANLALGIACGQPRIGVDIHVHRITNRWGYVAAASPEKTTVALEKVLPERYRVEINALLVPFGKHVCVGISPRCSKCRLLGMCRQVGVTSHR